MKREACRPISLLNERSHRELHPVVYEGNFTKCDYGVEARIGEEKKGYDVVEVWLQFVNLVPDMVVILSKMHKPDEKNASLTYTTLLGTFYCGYSDCMKSEITLLFVHQRVHVVQVWRVGDLYYCALAQ